MKEISLKTFLAHFCEDIREDKKFCFILGSGASRPSGIKTGGELVDIWMKELEDHYEEGELQEWFEKEKIDRNDPAAHYSKIFEKRFDLDKESGYAFLEKLMEGKEPSCGYSILAQILSETSHNIVITPNFDSLTEDALFIYTQKKPLVVGHESLANFIKPFTTRPLVIKIHHDLLLSPKNTSQAIEKMADGYARQLAEIFKYYTPIVIGYGGNDGSLMGFLQKLDRLDGRIFWCYRENDGSPGQRIRNVVEKLNGRAVRVKGFDELMIRIGNRLEFDRLDKKVLNIAEQRAKIYREQVEKITKALDVDRAASTALSEIVSRGERDWWYYEVQASKETDADKQAAIYKEGLKDLPDSKELLGNYAVFLKNIRREYDKAEKYYRQALEADPKDANTLGNYALFLKSIRREYDEAEKYYRQALEADPKHANNLGNYALFLQQIRREYDEAEKYYRQALEADPKDANTLGNYALFLENIRREYDEAEKYYRQALEADPKHANTLGNYVKLKIVQEDYSAAKDLLHKSFEFNTAENYEATLELELQFYSYAIFPGEYPDSRKKIEQLIDDGVRSPGWDLKGVLKVAKKHGHPDYPKLCEFERLITAREN